ncbi:unnamed protein product [Timema podura]|uniref:Uncharacterized protein n=1 Tax=Timema podura TaxID=61482 RepID=A0ABN7PL55_TIMPD|nr:unnamed protein product [Timema podura]
MCEKMASCAERTKIKEDFVELQKKLVALLDSNYKSPPNEQLKIQDFNLDIDTRERKIAEAEKEREERRNYLISLRDAQDRLCSMLKIQFWDSMDVKGRTIKAIFGCFEVDNYPLLPIDPAFEEQLKNVIQRRKIELRVNKDFFRPWEPTTTRFKIRFIYSKD